MAILNSHHVLFAAMALRMKLSNFIFLYFTRFAAQRAPLFASAERMCGHYWSEGNDQMKLFCIFNGFDNLNYLSRLTLISFTDEVQRYKISTSRLTPVFL